MWLYGPKGLEAENQGLLLQRTAFDLRGLQGLSFLHIFRKNYISNFVNVGNHNYMINYF